MDWKVVRKRSGKAECDTTCLQNDIPNFKHPSTRSKPIKPVPSKPCNLWLVSLVLLLLCHILTPGHCFFFPKSLFRRLSGSPQVQQPSSPQRESSHHHYPQQSHQEPLVGAEQQVNPIFTRGQQYTDQSQPNPNFHVPKALCIACEKFPWMPVAGPDNPPGNAGRTQSQPSHHDENQVELQSGSNDPPAKTIVISALGEAKGPVPPPPVPPQQQLNRKPFAIQFDSSPVQNSVPSKQTSGGYPSDNTINENKNHDPATRPISFQIYDPPRKPTVLQPVSFQQSGFSQEPALFMQPPPNVAFQFQQSQQNFVFRPPSVAYGRPTILQPVNVSNPPSSGGYGGPPPPSFVSTNVANNNSPIPPITIGTIVAAQQGRPKGSGQLPTFHEIQPGRLIYQEHTEVHGPQVAPFKNISPTNNRPQKQPHNIKLPIIPKPFGRPNQGPQQGYQGPPPPQQGYQGPPPPQQSQRPQQGYQGPPPPAPQQRPQQGYQGPPPPQQSQRPQQGYQGPPPPQAPQKWYQGPPPSPPKQGQQQGYQGPPPPPPPAKAPQSQGYQGPPPPQGGYQGPPPPHGPQQGYHGPPPPPPQFRPFQGGYLPVQHSEGGRHNPNIINLRAPPPPQPGDQVFFRPPPPMDVQFDGVRQVQYPLFSQGNQVAPNPQLGQTAEHSSPPNQRQPQQPQPQIDLQGSGSHSSKIVPPNNAPPSDYHHQSGSHVQSQREQIRPSSQTNNAFSTNQVSFNPSKGIVKNPLIQSIDQSNKTPQPNEPTSQSPQDSNSNSWEIIPAVQTDITHLFKTPEPTQPVKEVTTVPLPVPIPIPQSHSSKSPIFIVRGQGNQQDANQNENSKIFVQGITYHEENRGANFVGGSPTPPVVQQPSVATAQPTTLPYYTREYRGPEIPRLQPLVRPGIILRPHPNQLQQVQQQFDPLPASISTALYHAQRTSYLTHQGYVGQPGNGEKTVYVHSIPVRQGGGSESFSGGNNDVEQSSNYEPASSGINATHVSSNKESRAEESTGVPNSHSAGVSSSDQVTVNCQNHPKWVTAAEGNNHRDTNGEKAATTSAPTFSQDGNQQQPTSGGEGKPVLFYYPTPVQQQSSIYWVQPPQSSPGGGIVRLQPQLSIPNYEDETRETPNSLAFSPPIRQWSQKVTQSAVEPRNPTPEVTDADKNHHSTSANYPQNESDESDREPHDNYSPNIPFGQKLSVSRPTVTPFDIISVGGKDETLDDSRAQSLEQEESSSSQGSSAQQGESSQEGESGSSVNSEESTAYKIQSNSQEAPEVKVEGQINTLNGLPSQQGNNNVPSTHTNGGFVRPASTTIYHVPQNTQYATQSFKFPNFRPQQVYVHDFTQGGGRVTSIFEPTQQEDRTVGEQSQNVQSWRAFYNQPQKGPKLIDNYPPENDSDEERQFLAPSKTHVELTSGPPTTAECSTAETEPFTVTSTTTATEKTPTDTGRDKIRFRVGTSRFPGGRPSITSFNVRTTEKTTTTTQAVVHDLMSPSDDNDSTNPGSYSASISIPVYRPASSSREVPSGSKTEESSGLPNNLLNLDDIYKKSEMKQHSEAMTFKPSTTEESEVSVSPTTEESAVLSTMSTEKSSSFSISVDERMVDADNIELDVNKPRKVPSSFDGQKIEIKDFDETTPVRKSVKPVQIVTSSPVTNQNEFKPQSKIMTSVTTTPSSSANTSTKIVKTVRVRQRMRPGSSSSGFHGAIRNRFNGAGGGGRIRVVHRPVTPDYVKVFPESQNDKLAKDEEEEVKKALIELKRSERTNHTNHREFDLFHI